MGSDVGKMPWAPAVRGARSPPRGARERREVSVFWARARASAAQGRMCAVDTESVLAIVHTSQVGRMWRRESWRGKNNGFAGASSIRPPTMAKSKPRPFLAFFDLWALKTSAASLTTSEAGECSCGGTREVRFASGVPSSYRTSYFPNTSFGCRLCVNGRNLHINKCI